MFFVHGFNGSAMATWRNLDSLAPEYARFKDADLVFLGYRSLRHQTEVSSRNLYNSCDNMIKTPLPYIACSTIGASELDRDADFHYSMIIFVAHSLGAVVTRRLLLIAQQCNADWLDRVRVVLFAPAHMGATDVRKLPIALARSMGPFGPLIEALIPWKLQTLAELKEGSTTLKYLNTETRRCLSERRRSTLSKSHLVAHRVIFGDDEDVVHTTPFVEDPPHDPILNKGHVDVCKPTH